MGYTCPACGASKPELLCPTCGYDEPIDEFAARLRRRLRRIQWAAVIVAILVGVTTPLIEPGYQTPRHMAIVAYVSFMTVFIGFVLFTSLRAARLNTTDKHPVFNALLTATGYVLSMSTFALLLAGHEDTRTVITIGVLIVTSSAISIRQYVIAKRTLARL